MGKRPTSFNTPKNDWNAESRAAKELFDKAIALRGPGKKHLPTKQANLLQGLAFMRLCHAWENYLESSLLRYSVGVVSTVTPAPTLNPSCRRSSLETAFSMLSGGRASSTYYLTLSTPPQITTISSSVFATNDPYRFLSTVPYRDHLIDAVAIRNRVAHSSSKCKAEYKRVVNTFRGRAIATSIGQGCSAGEFVAESLATARFPGATAGTTVFEQYLAFFQHCVNKITP